MAFHVLLRGIGGWIPEFTVWKETANIPGKLRMLTERTQSFPWFRLFRKNHKLQKSYPHSSYKQQGLWIKHSVNPNQNYISLLNSIIFTKPQSQCFPKNDLVNQYVWEQSLYFPKQFNKHTSYRFLLNKSIWKFTCAPSCLGSWIPGAHDLLWCLLCHSLPCRCQSIWHSYCPSDWPPGYRAWPWPLHLLFSPNAEIGYWTCKQASAPQRLMGGG